MKILTLKGTIELLSGLHIGGGDDTMKIGGIDKEVIKIYDKDLKREVPYIPGSSLKGKIRSLLEWDLGLVLRDKPFGSDLLERVEDKEKALLFLKLFGDANHEKREEIGITRAIFCDAYLTEDMKNRLKNDEISVREEKKENSINRLTGTASNPREIERVPAGVEFSFEIKVKVLKNDVEDKFKELIERGLKLLEDDYLGGSGSRGYGRVKIKYKWS